MRIQKLLFGNHVFPKMFHHQHRSIIISSWMWKKPQKIRPIRTKIPRYALRPLVLKPLRKLDEMRKLKQLEKQTRKKRRFCLAGSDANIHNVLLPVQMCVGNCFRNRFSINCLNDYTMIYSRHGGGQSIQNAFAFNI